MIRIKTLLEFVLQQMARAHLDNIYNFNKNFEYIPLKKKIKEISVMGGLVQGANYMNFDNGSLVTNNSAGIFIMPKAKSPGYRGMKWGIQIVPDEKNIAKITNALN